MTGIEIVIEMMIDIETEEIGEEAVAEKEGKEGGMMRIAFYRS